MTYQTAQRALRGHVTKTLGALLAILALTAITGAPVQSDQPHPAPRTDNRAQVTVVDMLNGQWAGLEDAVAGWNQSPYVHLTVSNTCDLATWCVTIVAGAYGDTGWGAATGLPTNGTRYTMTRVNLSALPSFPTTADQTAVLCHELGHVLGIAHPLPGTSPKVHGCIAATSHDNTTPVVSAADLAALALVRAGTLPGDGFGPFAGS
jgi:predicted Zn-dependent protease